MSPEGNLVPRHVILCKDAERFMEGECSEVMDTQNATASQWLSVNNQRLSLLEVPHFQNVHTLVHAHTNTVSSLDRFKTLTSTSH